MVALRRAWLLALLIVACVVAACGGGGSNLPMSAPAATQEPPPSSSAVEASTADGAALGDACDVAGSAATPDDGCAQREWDLRRGAAWRAFVAAYIAAFDDGCAAVFDESPDGSLYADEAEYTELDCSTADARDAAASDLLPAAVPARPVDAGAAAGAYDGCVSIFDDAGGELYYGDEALDDSLC